MIFVVSVLKFHDVSASPLKHDRRMKGLAHDMFSFSLKITASSALKIAASYSAAAMSESGGKGELDKSKTVGKERSKREVTDGGRDGLIGGDGSVWGHGHGRGQEHHRNCFIITSGIGSIERPLEQYVVDDGDKPRLP